MAKAKQAEPIDRDDERKKRNSLDDARGPTAERHLRADGSVSIGDDQRGGKVYTFLDRSLCRIYARLARAAKTEGETDLLKAEYGALSRFGFLYEASGMVGSIGSVDCNRTYSPTPFGRTFLASGEWQADRRLGYHRAHDGLSKNKKIVVNLVVCDDCSLEIAGYQIGHRSQRRAIEAAEVVLRGAGFDLADGWGML